MPRAQSNGHHTFRLLAVLLSLLPIAAGPLAAESAGRLDFDPEKELSQYVHDTWQESDGLSGTSVLDILRGRDGYLWLATRGGLQRFDGMRFTAFHSGNTPMIASDSFTALAEDTAGTLWAGTATAGLVSYRDGRFAALRLGNRAADSIQDLLFDREGILWIATSGGLYRLRNGRAEAAALEGIKIMKLYEDTGGTDWIGTARHGIFERHGSLFEPVAGPKILSRGTIRAIYRDSAGRLWVSVAANGLLWREDGRWHAWTRADGLMSNDVYGLTEDRAGQLWIFAVGGVQRLRDGQFEDYRFTHRAGDWRLRSFYTDAEGNLWLGTYRSLERWRDGFIVNHADDTADLTAVRSIYEDRQDRLWLSTIHGRLYRFEHRRLRRHPRGRRFPESPIYSILEARDGTLWFATDDGLAHAVDEDWRFYTTADGLPENHVRLVYEDPASPDELWLGMWRTGLVHWRGGVLARYGPAEGLSGSEVRFIDRASPVPGDLWIGTLSGLNRLTHGRITAYTRADGLSSDFLTGTVKDRDGRRWFTTSGGGLMRFDEGRFFNYTTRDGLPTNDIWSILEHGEDFWLSSDSGIFRMRRDDFAAYDAGRIPRLQAVTYDTSDGMKTVECNSGGSPSSILRRDGTLWFPSMAGAVEIDPTARPEVLPPPVRIESLVADGAEVDLGGHLRLAPGQGDLELSYTALHLLHPRKLRFRRQLLGYDDAWVEAGARRTATYTNIPPGTYTFRVIAGDEGVWSEPGAALTFTLLPHFYQTRWFQIAAVLMFLLLVYGGVRLRLRSIRRRASRLQAEVEQRQRAEEQLARVVERLEDTVAELEGANDQLRDKNEEMERFVYTVSHDLKNPLVTIRGFLGYVRQDATARNFERLEKDLATIDSAADKMQQLLGDLLELSRVGRMANPPEDVPLGDLVADAVALVRGRIIERGGEVVSAPDLPMVYGDRQRLLQVLQNLIDNALKYTDGESSPRVEIDAVHEHGMTVVRVRDNGIGIAAKYHDTVFELFKRLDAASEGSGIGLALVQRIVEVHGGRVWVESEGEGMGSTFCLTLPERPS